MILLTKIKLVSRAITDWSKQQAPYSYLILISTLALILCSIWLLLLNTNASKKILVAENLYGQQMVEMAANRLSQATANNDLISMQAELNSLTQKELINSAVVYDLNNQATVKAGTPSERLDKQYTYQTLLAPISQDETFIGQLEIIATSTYQKKFIHGFTVASIFLLLGVIYFCIYKIKFYNSSITNTQSEPETTLEPTNSDQKVISISLLLQLKNINTIFQQLSKEVREEKLSEIKSTIEPALKLYSGRLNAMDESCLFMSICDYDKQQAVLNALCCAGLINKIANEEQWLVQTNAIIYYNEDEDIKNLNYEQLIANLHHISHENGRKIFIENVLTNNINDRCTTQAINKKITDFVAIDQFSDKYQKLLENQQKQLASI